MPSQIPPKISTVKNSAGTNIPKNGSVAGGIVDFTGIGFPGATLTISVTTNGVTQVPSTPTVLIDPITAKWAVNLRGLPVGKTVVTFTEVVPNPATVSWSFTVASGIKENFADLSGHTFEMNWRYTTRNNISINYNSANTGSIRNAREFWTPTSAGFKGKLEGNVFCINYLPTHVNTYVTWVTLFLSKSQDDNTGVPFSTISFFYISQVECILYARDANNNPVEQKTLPASPTIPLQATLSRADIYSITIEAPAISEVYSPSWSCVFGNLEITPQP